jgi:hypothetical protein
VCDNSDAVAVIWRSERRTPLEVVELVLLSTALLLVDAEPPPISADLLVVDVVLLAAARKSGRTRLIQTQPPAPERYRSKRQNHSRSMKSRAY